MILNKLFEWVITQYYPINLFKLFGKIMKELIQRLKISKWSIKGASEIKYVSYNYN